MYVTLCLFGDSLPVWPELSASADGRCTFMISETFWLWMSVIEDLLCFGESIASISETDVRLSCDPFVASALPLARLPMEI